MEDKNLTPDQLKLILDRLDESQSKLINLIENIHTRMDSHMDSHSVRLDNMSAGLSLDIKAANSHLDTIAGGLSADIREVKRMDIIIVAVIGVPIVAASYTYVVSELSKYW